MIFRQLGEDSVSLIGLGTVKIGRNHGVKYPDAFEIPKDAEVKVLLETASELGINVIDTAPAYGESESRLGGFLRGQRQDWHIISKVGEEFYQGQSYFNFSEEYIRASVERSLKRLGTDYIDTLLIHSDGNDVALIQHGVLDILLDIKKKGWIRYIGMSTKTVAGGLLALEKSDVVMATYHLQYKDELPVFERAISLQKSMLVKKVFASGHLHTDALRKQILDEVSAMTSVASIIIGTCQPKHLRDNVALLDPKK